MCNQLPTNPTGPRSIIFVVSNNIEAAAVYMHKKMKVYENTFLSKIKKFNPYNSSLHILIVNSLKTVYFNSVAYTGLTRFLF